MIRLGTGSEYCAVLEAFNNTGRATGGKVVFKVGAPTVSATRYLAASNVLEAEINRLKALGVRVRVLMAVPKFWVFLMKDILEEMKNKPVWHGLYRHLAAVERHAGVTDLGTLDKAKLCALRIFVRNKMGGAFSFGISSSSRLDPGIAEVFARLLSAGLI